ncbi:MAG TPA: DUF4105 domain-containing protein [Kofleriaceae bacterium]
MAFRTLVLAVLFATAATASADPVPGTSGTNEINPPGMVPPTETISPTIELVTMGIGSLIWERHGHIALCVTRAGMASAMIRPQQDDYCYNYGIGDFHDPMKMVWGFFRGTHSFWVGKDTPPQMLWVYKKFDRTIWAQKLPLDDAQKQKVIAKLENDITEEHRYYAYDHFDDNCTTRIRDIIDNVTDHALSKMTDLTDGASYRDLARDGFAGMRIPLLATDVALGRSADRVPTYWDRMFLPQYLREAVQTKWGLKPQILYQRSECRGSEDPSCIARGIPTVENPPSGRVIAALVILVLTAPVWLTRRLGRFQRIGLAVSILPYWLLGTIETFLAIISPLPYVHINETCLLWFPLDIAILFLAPETKVKYAKFRVGMIALQAVLMLINVFHQPLWPEILWPLIPMATVAFWRKSK